MKDFAVASLADGKTSVNFRHQNQLAFSQRQNWTSKPFYNVYRVPEALETGADTRPTLASFVLAGRAVHVFNPEPAEINNPCCRSHHSESCGYFTRWGYGLAEIFLLIYMQRNCMNSDCTSKGERSPLGLVL